MITVGHCGYDSRHRTRLEMRRPGGTPDYTLLLIKTEAFFRIDGKLCRLRPGTVILYEPSVPVHYGSVGASYNDDWIHFLPEDCDLPFLQELKLPCNTPCTLSFTGQLSEYARMIVLEKKFGASLPGTDSGFPHADFAVFTGLPAFVFS